MAVSEGPQIVGRPLVPAAGAFLLGVLIEGPGPMGSLALALGAGLACMILARRRSLASVVFMLLSFVGAAMTAQALDRPTPETLSTTLGGTPVEGLVLEGQVRDAPVGQPERRRIIIDLRGAAPRVGARLVPVRGRVRLTLPGASRCGAPGDRVRVWASVRPLRLGPRFPGDDRGTGRARRSGIQLVGWVKAGGICVTMQRGAGPQLALARLRLRIARRIDSVLSQRASRALVRALAVGDRSGLGPEVRVSFADAGLAHLLAVSGLHLAVVVGLFGAGLTALLRRSAWVALGPGADTVAAVCAVGLVLVYTPLVGASPSAVRAALMLLPLLAGTVLGRLRDVWSALALASVLMLAWDPATVGDLSFLLSFSAVIGLLRLLPALRDRWAPRLSEWPRWRRYPVEVALASAAATLATAPVIARTFHRVSLAGLVANIPAAPLASLVAVPASLLGGLLAALQPELARPVLTLAAWSVEALQSLAEATAAMPGAAVAVPPPNDGETVLIYGALLLLSRTPRPSWARYLGLGCLGGALLSFLGATFLRTAAGELRVTHLPVGQGDAAVVELPEGEVVLVDVGPVSPGYDTAERVILPFLAHRRIRRLDVVVLTHPHADHVGGLATLLARIHVGAVWWAGEHRSVPPELLAVLGSQQVRIVRAQSPPIHRSGARIDILGPVGSPVGFEHINDGSVVLRITKGGRSVLLTGDAEAGAERALMIRCAPCLQADVLKVGHHGSRTSSTEVFLDAVGPTHAVVSVGARNRFGLPDEEVLQALSRRGITVWRTDVHGAITIRTDGTSLAIEPYVP